MKTIFLVVRKSDHDSGHGESETLLSLVTTGRWDENLAPAYTDRCEAEKHMEILGDDDLMIVELSLLDRAAP